MNFAIGVDLGGTNLRIAAVSEQGELLEKVTTSTKVSLGRTAVINEMTEAIKEVAAKFGVPHRLLGVGIGVPGIVDTNKGVLRKSPNLPGWNDYPVQDEIERRLGTPVLLENDANVAAVGEAWLGAARGSQSLCMITLGTGVGGGIVSDGRVWHGINGMAGELGHMNIDPTGPDCGCGSCGCVEQFASATAVVRMAREAIASGHAPELARAASSDAEFNARAVHNLAMQGDKPAQEIFRKMGWALGLLIADLVNVLNLHVYVIGGGVASAWESFAPALFEEVQRRSFVYAATAPDEVAAAAVAKGGSSAKLRPIVESPCTVITRALLGSDAGLFGAARLPMQAREHTQRYSWG